jgi:S1-C subfamily serine protease
VRTLARPPFGVHGRRATVRLLLPLVLSILVASVDASPRPAADDVATVLVRGGDAFGTGVVWNASEGLVLTALHVVEQMPGVTVSFAGGAALRARVIDVDPMLDLALLSVGAPFGRPPARARRADRFDAGDAVTVLGCPGERCGAARAVLLDRAHRFAGSTYLALQGAVEAGTSGGAVVDARGRLVGIVDLVVHGARETTLAIPVAAALARFPTARLEHASVETDAEHRPARDRRIVEARGPALPP